MVFLMTINKNENKNKNKNIIKEKAITYEIQIIKIYKPNKMQKKLINFLNKIILESKYRKNSMLAG